MCLTLILSLLCFLSREKGECRGNPIVTFDCRTSAVVIIDRGVIDRVVGCVKGLGAAYVRYQIQLLQNATRRVLS